VENIPFLAFFTPHGRQYIRNYPKFGKQAYSTHANIGGGVTVSMLVF